MTWPPPNRPAGGWSNASPQFDDHPAEHNTLAAWAADVEAELNRVAALVATKATGLVQSADIYVTTDSAGVFLVNFAQQFSAVPHVVATGLTGNSNYLEAVTLETITTTHFVGRLFRNGTLLGDASRRITYIAHSWTG